MYRILILNFFFFISFPLLPLTHPIRTLSFRTETREERPALGERTAAGSGAPEISERRGRHDARRREDRARPDALRRGHGTAPGEPSSGSSFIPTESRMYDVERMDLKMDKHGGMMELKMDKLIGLVQLLVVLCLVIVVVVLLGVVVLITK